mmetsp:Transcript_3556/g.6235  ORF Transcript_3556/g.6235 Transcript_3556/m.6235 type:complete len:250 (-) Transcript_3556:92-841(-)
MSGLYRVPWTAVGVRPALETNWESSSGDTYLDHSCVPGAVSRRTRSATTMLRAYDTRVRFSVDIMSPPPGLTSAQRVCTNGGTCATCSTTSEQTTASKDWPDASTSSADVTSYLTRGATATSCRACLRAASMPPRDASMPVTLAPRRARGSDRNPAPQPTSNMLSPSRVRGRAASLRKTFETFWTMNGTRTAFMACKALAGPFKSHQWRCSLANFSTSSASTDDEVVATDRHALEAEEIGGLTHRVLGG